MSVRNFKFVSPGVFVNEIDNSQLPATPQRMGPVIVGRTERGPSMRPVTVQSFSDFIEIFGNPIPGGKGDDVWRDGNYMGPTYAAYAAQAYLRNSAPVTMVKLAGTQHSDATSAGKAGWKTSAAITAVNSTNGGAYGLFIIPSGSGDANKVGGLAAVWYLNEGTIRLSGNAAPVSVAAGTATASNCMFIDSQGASNQFKVIIENASNVVQERISFNFNEASSNYIRKVFNTNPTLVNSTVTATDNLKTYWLGESYERHIDTLATSSAAGDTFGLILGLKSTLGEKGNYQQDASVAKSGWIISQDLSDNSGSYNPTTAASVTKLFRLHSLNVGGEWECRNLKVSIQDLKKSTSDHDPYGSFTLVVRSAADSDSAISVMERFSNLNLNPFSPNYVARRIGDKYVTWDDAERRYRNYGNHGNQSRFFRVEMNTDVDAGAVDAKLLPFGGYGPPRFNSFSIVSGTTAPVQFIATPLNTTTAVTSPIVGGVSIPYNPGTARLGPNQIDVVLCSDSTNNDGDFTGSFRFPSIALRVSSSDGNLSNQKNAYFGVDTGKSTTNDRYMRGYRDLVRAMPTGVDNHDTSADTEYSFVFSLDDLVTTGTIGGSQAFWLSGSRAGGRSATAVSSSWEQILDDGFDRFTLPVFGAFDGLDIKEVEPFRNSLLDGKTELTNYAYNSVKRAIDIVSDPEVVECNLMAVPGVVTHGITSHLINVCEDRADAMAVIDLSNDYEPRSESTSAESARVGTVATAVTSLRDRNLNSSYAACYYPWVQISDTLNGANLWVPPSVAALGTYASNDRNAALWFAPAGFTRGGLTVGSAGLPVIGVRQRLRAADRDKLYEANINPIATFPAEGIVIFGQKTLQVTPSALDRVNVRRLMIYIKKEISRMAATLLFDQNVLGTWNAFLGRVEPFLADIQSRLGLTDYRVILDNTTTTPDLIDRNIMYAKIFLKPARSIEFIAIDFNITDSGASFAD